MNKIVPAHNIGGYVPMIDGPEKVSGRAKYTADILQPGMLAGRIYRSPYSHGEIVAVDVSEALKVPGVRAIVTGADCDKAFGVLPIARTEYPLARDRVRYRGEPVAAVAADRRRQRTRSAAPHQVHGARIAGLLHIARRRSRPAPSQLHEKKPGNVERDVLFELGSSEQGFAQADLVREGTYNCAEVCQNQMEMHAAIAEYDAAARTHDRACLDASALLRASDAGANSRHGNVAHPRDQAACRRRLRLPHRDAGDRIDRRAAGAQVQRHCAAGDDA